MREHKGLLLDWPVLVIIDPYTFSYPSSYSLHLYVQTVLPWILPESIAPALPMPNINLELLISIGSPLIFEEVLQYH